MAASSFRTSFDEGATNLLVLSGSTGPRELRWKRLTFSPVLRELITANSY